MIYIEDLEQIANNVADIRIKGIRTFSVGIEIPDKAWHQFEDSIHKYYQQRLKYVKAFRNYENGISERSHYLIHIGEVTIKCYRAEVPDYEPRISKYTERW